MLKLIGSIKENLRRKIVLGTALMMLVLPSFITATVESAQTKTSKKATPTPKKKTTPTPKKTTAKTKPTPTPKRTPAKTNAKTKPTPKPTPKTASKSKTAPKTTVSKTTDKNKNSKTAVKNTKSTDKNASKNVKPSNSKTTVAKTTKPTPKSTPKPKQTTDTKSKTTVIKNESVKTPANAPQIIVTGFSVPIRSEARTSAPSVSKIKLGTVLKVTEKNPAWYRVQYVSGGKTANGWISANAVNDLNSSEKNQIYRQIVERNYKAEMDFAAAAELYEFMSGVSGELDKSDASAEFELKRLMVLRSALKGISFESQKQSPHKEFLKTHEKAIVYNEPAGQYLVAANQFWELHGKYQKSVISDRIAWEAALNPLPGECEGYVNCYLFDMRMRFGEYLNLHPNGKNSAEALTNITNYLAPIVADTKKEIYNGPTDVTDRAEFNNLIAELRTIVARLGFVEKEKTLQQLKQIAEAYR